MTLEKFNQLSFEQAKEELFKCCGCISWSEKVALKIPFSSRKELELHADRIWENCDEKDFLEAFSQHPKIGEIKSLPKKFESTKHWAASEQAAVKAAAKTTLEKLTLANELYEKKFGFIFIVCATGKRAEQMLELLNQRISNTAADEIKIAANEQNKITHIRIAKLFS